MHEAPRDRSPEPIRIAAAVIMDGKGRQLLVRKVGTSIFMQAGGKIEPGETPLTALRRELHEELGLELDPARPPPFLGLYRAEAALEPGRMVEAHVFAVKISEPVQAQAEIDEAIWLDPNAPAEVPLAPLTRLHALRWASAAHIEKDRPD